MISQLAFPSVCVVDEDPADYRPILDALNSLFVSTIHILGNDLTKLPKEPFKGLKLIFVDLHLTAASGKVAASHTANVFNKIVSPGTAPVVVVIWSKYADAKVVADDVPPEDQETVADLFKRILLESEPEYAGRLIFLEMTKPQKDDRPEDWTAKLAKKIERTLGDQSAVDFLWQWDRLVHEACVGVSSDLTAKANSAANASGAALKDSLKDVMRLLAKARAGTDLKNSTAHRHLAGVLADLLVDHLEHSEVLEGLTTHGNWLRQKPATIAKDFAAHMNGLLLTASISANADVFVPGTVYRAKNAKQFYEVFGKRLSTLADMCCQSKRPSQKWRCWRAWVQPVAIELSPECDVAQCYRTSAFVVAGLVVPTAFAKEIKKAEFITKFPAFHLRHDLPKFSTQDAFLIVCHRYKATLSLNAHPNWFEPWFRLRELPTAALRNSYAGQASRIGYVSLSE
ncbi:MAG: hypothetical protein J0H10_15280 [Alphaproteobacteria bacterium]|nr:hypothetical protein [Alphaproteobacteria bacterium]